METVEVMKEVQLVKSVKLVCPKCNRVKNVSPSVLQLSQKYNLTSRCNCGHITELNEA